MDYNRPKTDRGYQNSEYAEDSYNHTLALKRAESEESLSAVSAFALLHLSYIFTATIELFYSWGQEKRCV
jgi:hypothetical protein